MNINKNKINNIEDILNREDIKLATTRNRTLAFVIDDLIISLFMMAIFWDSIVNASSIEETIMVINQAFFEIMALKVIYHTFFIWKYGQTIGKIVVKIRVIQIDTIDNPNLLISINRAIFRVVSEIFFYVGFILAFFDVYKQSLHDKTAKTLVINV